MWISGARCRRGRPGCPPAVLLRLFTYGYLNRNPSSRRFEREARRKVAFIWLNRWLVPDHRAIADFCPGTGRSCVRIVGLCRRIGVWKVAGLLPHHRGGWAGTTPSPDRRLSGLHGEEARRGGRCAADQTDRAHGCPPRHGPGSVRHSQGPDGRDRFSDRKIEGW
ncbi:transposase [Falsigemmobacter faecalis]|uniref:Transposase n=1 Tax=Falsigemmobacter faecalis TaxID=2488730 RepID=A0A3P3DV01_9RHOB|nr:transposase [Falsigemmobacter faecalis]